MAAIRRFRNSRIMVVGDAMLDVFIWGEVQRISPEAPVPVVDVREQTRRLGGSANVAGNIAALGAQPLLVAVIGNDIEGGLLRELLETHGEQTTGLFSDGDRPTTVKTRIVAHNQQVVRFDQERRMALAPRLLSELIAFIDREAPACQGIIVSDYGKGVVSPPLMDAVRRSGRKWSIPVLVDPKVQNSALYQGVTLLTPNHQEAAQMAGVAIEDEASLLAAGRTLLAQLECQQLLITRGRDGMTLFQPDGDITHIPTSARRVYDVTGAGDTVIATLALGLTAGLGVSEAARLANVAAGIVVAEVGTATVTADHLSAAVNRERVP